MYLDFQQYYGYRGQALHRALQQTGSFSGKEKSQETRPDPIPAEQPSILGLGDLILKDKERRQPKAGRLDLLLQDMDSNRRYEVEIQLGATDESHLIRTIEYWDIERKRYPQYDHCAVIVAEDITSRFLNVIGLFNSSIPLVAIQMSAIKIGDSVGLVFTTVLDEITLGLDEGDEGTEVTDRGYWETKGSKQTVALADRLLQMIQSFAPGLELKYNKFYIGLAKEGRPNNFVLLRAKKKYLRLEIRLSESEDIQKMFDNSDLEVIDYDNSSRRYRIRVTEKDIENSGELFTDLIKQAYENSSMNSYLTALDSREKALRRDLSEVMNRVIFIWVIRALLKSAGSSYLNFRKNAVCRCNRLVSCSTRGKHQCL